jgi:hypothetical protein
MTPSPNTPASVTASTTSRAGLPPLSGATETATIAAAVAAGPTISCRELPRKA